MAAQPIPEDQLLDAIIAKSSKDDLTQDWLDQVLPECMAYLVAGPASCRRQDWTEWEKIPAMVQSLLVGVLSRHASMGQGTIAEERIGDYSVRYTDSALFEGRIPRFFNDGEELAIAKLSGCFSTLYSVRSGGMPLHDYSRVEEDLYQELPLGYRATP